MKRKSKKAIRMLDISDERGASFRMQAIEVAARLPEPSGYGHGQIGGGYPSMPGKSAEKVVADAEKIMAFVTKTV